MGWIADLLQEIPSAARYKSELEAMEKQNISLREEVKMLQQKLHEANQYLTNITETSSLLDSLQVQILQLLFSAKMYHRDIISSLGINAGLVDYHIHELENAGLIERSLSMLGTEFPWYITQEGRRYLIGNSLVV